MNGMGSRRGYSLMLLIVGYYGASTLTSCLTKMVLNDFPRPITVSLVQQSVASLGGLIRVGSVSGALREWRAALPVAAALLMSSVLYRISLVHNSLSFSQAVKTLQPLFATLLSAIFLRERSSPRRILSLLMLLAGVSITTTTELSFSLVGFVCTVGSCFAQALQSVLSKSLLVHNRIGEEHLFACAAVYTMVMLVPLWLAADAFSLLSGEAPQLVGSGALWLLLLNGLANFASQVLSFSVLCAVVSPVSASVVSTFKRVVTIGTAIFWFRTDVTLPHVVGIGIAVLAIALFQERDTRSAEAATPHVPSPLALEHTPFALANNPRRRDREKSAHRQACCRAV